MYTIFSFLKKQKPTGQSLIETAIAMPIIVLLLAGVVEVSNLLITQNRVSTAARAATGYGASHFSGEEWVKEAKWENLSAAMAEVAQNNVTETLEMDPERWDIWAVKAAVALSGSGDPYFTAWDYVHVSDGVDFTVMTEAGWAADEAEVQQQVLDGLDMGSLSADDLELVATVAYHHRRSLLGMNAFDLGEFTRIRGINVMRTDQPAPYRGCDLMPITVWNDGYSAYPSNWQGGQLHPSRYPDDPVNILPSGNGQGGFQEPVPAPVYTVPDPFVYEDPNNFVSNDPGVPLADAQRGFVYWAREQSGAGGFGWLDWNAPPADRGDLQDSLDYPGDFWNVYPGSDIDMDNLGVGFTTGDGDGSLEPGEWIHGSTGNVNSLDAVLENNWDRVVRMVVVDDQHGTGLNKIYRVKGFILVEFVGYSFQGNDKWMAIKFIRWDNDCDIWANRP